MKARLQIDSIGSHSSWHVEYYLHISLWKRCGLCGGQGWLPVPSVCWVATRKTANCFLLAFVLCSVCQSVKWEILIVGINLLSHVFQLRELIKKKSINVRNTTSIFLSSPSWARTGQEPGQVSNLKTLFYGTSLGQSLGIRGRGHRKTAVHATLVLNDFLQHQPWTQNILHRWKESVICSEIVFLSLAKARRRRFKSVYQLKSERAENASMT